METGKAAFAHTRIGPFSPLPDDELWGGGGNATESGGRLVLVATDGDIFIDVGVFGGESVGGGGGGDGDRGSMVAPTTVVPISESTGEPVVGVSRKQ